MTRHSLKRSTGRARRVTLLLIGLIVPQILLIGASLVGSRILLPLDILRLPWIYLPENQAGAGASPSIDPMLSDIVLQLEPDREFAVRQVRSGHLPLWNPNSYCGAPFLAANQPAVLSPFRLLDYLWPGTMATAWGQLLRRVVAGIGAYLFLRRSLRVRFLPAAIGAWCFPLTGFLTLWAGFPIEWEVTWLPLLLWTTDCTVRRPRGGGWIGLALITACTLVAGHSATGAQMLLLDGAYGIWAAMRRGWRSDAPREPDAAPPPVGAQREPRRSGPRRALLALGLGWIVGILLSLPQTLPTLEYVAHSHRITARAAGVLESSPVGIEALPEIVLPYFYGSHEMDSAYLLPTNRLEGMAAGYVGLIAALILAPVGWRSRRHRGALMFWGIAAIVGAGQILNIPLLSWLYRAPVLNTLRGNRMVFITAFAILVWAVIGLDQLLRRRIRGRGWVIGLSIAPVCLMGLCLYRYWNMPRALLEKVAASQASPAAIDRFGQIYLNGAAWCAVALAIVTLIAAKIQRRSIVIALVGGVCIIELLSRAWNSDAQSDPALYFPRLGVLDAIAASAPGRMCGVRYLPAALNLSHDLPDVRGYDAADPDRFTELLDRINDPSAQHTDAAQLQWFFPRGESPVLDLIDLRYLVYREPPPGGANIVWSGSGHYLVVRPTANTRVFVPRHVEVIPETTQRLQRMTGGTWDPRLSLILESSSANSIDSIDGTANIVIDEPMRIQIEAQMKTPGYLLLADGWDPGWRATVNGETREILRADHAFRAVEVPAGVSRIEFRYEPASWRVGCVGAGAGAAVVLAGVIGATKRRGRPSRASSTPAENSLRQ